MKVNLNLVLLGMVKTIHFIDKRGSLNVETWPQSMGYPERTDKNRAALFATPDRKSVYIVPWNKPRFEQITPGSYPRQVLTARLWFNYEPDEKIKIDFPNSVKSLAQVGLIKEIEYTSDKFETPKDRGKWNLFFHPAKRDTNLFVNCPITPFIWGIQDPQGRTLLNYRGLIF